MLHRTIAFVLSLIIIFHVFASELISQEASKKEDRIRVIMEGSDEFGVFGYSILRSLEKAFTERNILVENDSITTNIIYNIREVDSTTAAVSVIILEPMPKDVINLAAKAEVFYANLSEQKKSELLVEGKSIREYVSAEYLKQFTMVWDNILEIVNKDNLEEFSQKIVNKFISAAEKTK